MFCCECSAQNNTLTEDKSLINKVFLETGRAEFVFIGRSGFYFGCIFGLFQMIGWTFYKGDFQLPLFGLLVGYLTNFIALRMIFRPQLPKKFGPLTIQGLFHKRQKEVARDYARLIADEIVTPRKILEAVLTGVHSDRVFTLIARNVQRAIDEQAGFARPFVRPPGRALPRFVRPPPVAAPPVVTPPVTPPHEQQRRAIPFVAQLKRMIEERPEIIRWRRGDIVIPDPAALERNLSKYYKHSKYASFQRQLNNFGYRRSLGNDAETVYERQGASENLDDLLALRPVRPAPGGVKKRGRDEPPASPPHQRVRVAAAPPAAFDAAASLLALGAS